MLILNMHAANILMIAFSDTNALDSFVNMPFVNMQIRLYRHVKLKGCIYMHAYMDAYMHEYDAIIFIAYENENLL